MKKIAIIGIAAFAMHLNAAPSVEITNVQQQYPWTNTVDITYNVSGITNKDYFVVFVAQDENAAIIGAKTNVLENSSNGQTTQWEPPFNIRKLNCTMTPYVYRGGADDYMIVDLETWAVTYEGMVGSQENANAKYNAPEYKTKKMVFRKIETGTYTIGDSTLDYNPPHQITVAKPYYMAIFPTTVSQYQRIMDEEVETEQMIGKNNLSWNTIRGSAGAAAVPTTGPIANLISKTKTSGFDLPTVAMWETAARAGETARWQGGSYEAQLAYAWTESDASEKSIDVGTKQANQWGFYDTMGLLFEYLRDVITSSTWADEHASKGVFTPVSTGTAGYIAAMGGRVQWTNADKACISYIINTGSGQPVAKDGNFMGFRLAYIPE